MLLYARAWISPFLLLRSGSIISALHPPQQPADRCTQAAREHQNTKITRSRLSNLRSRSCRSVVIFRLRQLKIALSTCDVKLKRRRLKLNRQTGLISVALTWLDTVDKSRLKPKMGDARRHCCCQVKVTQFWTRLSESNSQYHQFCCQKITDYFQKSSCFGVRGEGSYVFTGDFHLPQQRLQQFVL